MRFSSDLEIGYLIFEPYAFPRGEVDFGSHTIICAFSFSSFFIAASTTMHLLMFSFVCLHHFILSFTIFSQLLFLPPTFP